MKDFFRVMGKAFAVVFGSTFALALVLVLLALAMRPLLKYWLQAREAPGRTQAGEPPQAGSHEVPGKPEQEFTNIRPITGQGELTPTNPKECTALPKESLGPPGFLIDSRLVMCDKDGCAVYLPSAGCSVAHVSWPEIAKAQRIPVGKNKAKP
jgi:hypothetical protein